MVTLQDVADYAGFSKTAVSHVLNGREKENRISQRTATIIRGVAKDLGYQCDDLAKAVSTGRSNVVGFVMNPASLEFSSPILMALQKKLFQHKYYVKIINYEHGVTTAADLLNVCFQQKLAGVVSYVLPEDILREMASVLKKKNIPFAVAGGKYDLAGCIQVHADNFQGGRVATKHLLDLGHRKIAFVTNTQDTPYCLDRKNGFASMMSERGLEAREDFMIVSENRLETKALLEAMMRRPDRPTAFFCVSDMLALTCLMTLAQNGFSTPGDVSVTGYANTMAASHSVPSLTSVEERPARTGERIADRILARISGSDDAPEPEALDVRLMVRESTGPAKIIGVEK